MTKGRCGSRKSALLAILVGAIGLTAPALAGEEPKRRGTLTYMIPADGPPSFDGHREATCATVHSAAPYYSVLIRINPDNPGSANDFVCDLCTAMLHETDPAKQRVLMRQFEKYVLDEQTHEIKTLWWYRIVSYRSYVKGWKISPSHFVNQDLATIWLDK